MAMENDFLRIIKDFIDNNKPFSSDIDEEGTFGCILSRGAFVDKIKIIDKKLSFVKKFKIVFHGGQCSGKSEIINAILGEKVLPSAKGSTQSCIVKVEGCDRETGYFIDEKGEEKDLQGLSAFVKEKGNNKTSTYEESVVAVFYPRKKCELLEGDIQLIDVPSSTVKCDLIRQCEIADVLVHVFDSDHLITDEEREYYKKMKDKKVNARSILLINKWDRCEYEMRVTEYEEWQNRFRENVEEFSSEKLYFVSAKDFLNNKDMWLCKARTGEFNEFLQRLKCLHKEERPVSSKISSLLSETIDLCSHITYNEGKKVDYEFEEEIKIWIKAMSEERKNYFDLFIKTKCKQFILNKTLKIGDKIDDVINKIQEDIQESIESRIKEVSSKLSEIYGEQEYLGALKEYKPQSMCLTYLKGIPEVFDRPEGEQQLIEEILLKITMVNVDEYLKEIADSLIKTIRQVIEHCDKNRKAAELFMRDLGALKDKCEEVNKKYVEKK